MMKTFKQHEPGKQARVELKSNFEVKPNGKTYG